jgi:hypothetical protein
MGVQDYRSCAAIWITVKLVEAAAASTFKGHISSQYQEKLGCNARSSFAPRLTLSGL